MNYTENCIKSDVCNMAVCDGKSCKYYLSREEFYLWKQSTEEGKMSTRAQCFIKDEGIYLYQHYNGYNLMDKVVKAVNGIGRYRQDDPEYLARIIFCEMVKGDEGGVTGYGIGTKIHGDIEFLVTVDCKKRTITETDGEGNVLRVVNFK